MTGFDNRRENLLAVAARVFAATGYDRTSMRDLARASSMSLAGMYYYVKGKEDLLFQIQRNCFELVQQGALDAIGGQLSAEERLAAFIRHHVTFFATHMAEMKVLAHEAESLSGAGLETVRRLKRGYVEVLLGLLTELGGHGSGEQVDRHVAAYTLFGMMNWIYTWYDPKGPVDVAELADSITRLFLNGYSAEV
ncbi:MAG: TetR/AcrR family transcriptional regulator, partial [Gemmatimonadales bacterium]|nr:TetR/AcrR family transcriptional regulator [Gemmatimonadales bacterium]